MHVRPIISTMAALLLLASVRAEAVSVRDIIELSAAGLSDEVLVALIGVDGTVFSLDARQLLELKSAGVRDPVLLAMLRSGRPRHPETTVAQPFVAGAPAAPPVVVVEDRQEPRRQPYPLLVSISVVVPVPRRSPNHHLALQRRNLTSKHRIGLAIPGHVHDNLGVHGPGKPVYWGWGGKRRPDTWAPARGVHDHTSR